MNTNLTTIKETIEASGRYDEIQCILNKILNKNTVDFPVGIKVNDDNKVIRRVYKTDVNTGIAKLYEVINTTGEDTSIEDKKALESLSYLIESELDMRLHNFANDCSHRKTPDESVLEDIRAYEILNSALNHIIYNFHDPDTGAYWDFSIPDGWKKVA